MSDLMSAKEIQAEWAKRSLTNIQVGEPEPTREFHVNSMRIFDQFVGSLVVTVSGIDRELTPSAYEGRLAKAFTQSAEALRGAIEPSVAMFGKVSTLYKMRQAEAAASLLPDAVKDRSAWEIRTSEVRRQLEALAPGAERFNAVWVSLKNGRVDVMEAIHGSVVPLFNEEDLQRLEAHCLENASPQATKARGDAEKMLAEVERTFALIQMAFRAEVQKKIGGMSGAWSSAIMQGATR